MQEIVATAIAEYLRGRVLEVTERVLATGGAIECAKAVVDAMMRNGVDLDRL